MICLEYLARSNLNKRKVKNHQFEEPAYRLPGKPVVAISITSSGRHS